MHLRMLSAFALFGVVVASVQSADAQDAETAEERAEGPAEVEYSDRFPPKLEGVYARKPSGCRNRSFSVAGKVGIRGKRLIVDGQPFEIGEVLQSSQIALIGDFVAPGGYGKPVRMSFTIRKSGKLIVRTFGGRTAPPMLAHYRCKPRRS